MQLLTTILSFLLLMPIMGLGQEKAGDLIPWSQDRPLSWTDYKANPDPASDAAASTSTNLGVDFHIEQGKLSYTIQCNFSPAKSWGRSKTEAILKHEQGHFDITEIFARKLHQQLKEYRFNSASYRSDLANIYNRITREKEEWQDRYDRETDHSRKPGEQSRWLKKILDSLNSLRDYSDY